MLHRRLGCVPERTLEDRKLECHLDKTTEWKQNVTENESIKSRIVRDLCGGLDNWSLKKSLLSFMLVRKPKHDVEISFDSDTST